MTVLPEKIRVILITDGDSNACQVIEFLAAEMGLRCISASAGNPTPISGEEIIALLKQTPNNPVLVMFDDRGNPGKGKGESVMEQVASHPDVTVLGALAVASGTDGAGGASVDFSINRWGEIEPYAVDKYGQVYKQGSRSIMHGDTLSILDSLQVPVVIGIGDIGKMGQADSVVYGAPITRKAITEILKRSDVLNDSRTENRQRS
nr:stage V sporulation protein AE [Anaerosporomusa subterranea]